MTKHFRCCRGAYLLAVPLEMRIPPHAILLHTLWWLLVRGANRAFNPTEMTGRLDRCCCARHELTQKKCHSLHGPINAVSWRLPINMPTSARRFVQTPVLNGRGFNSRSLDAIAADVASGRIRTCAKGDMQPPPRACAAARYLESVIAAAAPAASWRGVCVCARREKTCASSRRSLLVTVRCTPPSHMHGRYRRSCPNTTWVWHVRRRTYTQTSGAESLEFTHVSIVADVGRDGYRSVYHSRRRYSRQEYHSILAGARPARMTNDSQIVIVISD